MTFRKWPPDVADAGAKAWLESIAEDVRDLRRSIDALTAAVNRDNASIRDGLETIEQDFGRLANAMDPRAAKTPDWALAKAAMDPKNAPSTFAEFTTIEKVEDPC